MTSTQHIPSWWRTVAVGLGFAGAVALLWLMRQPATPGHPAAALAPAAQPTPSAVSAAAGALHREPADVVPGFDDYVAWLVQCGLRTARCAANGDTAAALASDAEAKRLFEQMLAHVADADELALAATADHPEEPADDAGRMRERVLALTLDIGLQRRPALAPGDRRRLDAMVAHMLTVMPQSPRLPALLGEQQLVDKPYLGLAHEPAVLGLFQLAGQGQFPSAIAVALLQTLWQNLAATGARSSQELASLALLLFDDSDPGKRLAACRQLLLDARYRDVVLARAKERKDAALAAELCAVAAQQLSPAAALAVLAELGPLAPTALTVPYLALAQRDAAAVCAAYERHLADDVRPGVRAELITGAGFTRSAEGIELARLALHADRDNGVRVRAMFVLTGNAAAALGESAMSQLLDDPAFANDADCIGAAVLALENLERANLINAIDRLGQRLRQTALRAGDRDNLERILARALPGGRTSR
jgi:hypothetical protein